VTLQCFFHKADGTLVQKNTSLNGFGIAPIPIRLSLPNISYSAQAGAQTRIPISILDTSFVDVRTLSFDIAINTDLLTPTNFDLTGSIFAGASISTFKVNKNDVLVELGIPPGKRTHSGLVGTLICKPFVTDTNYTDITERLFSLLDQDSSASCLPTVLVTPPQSVTSFTLSRECGTTSLSKYIRYGADAIFVEHITPNPTHSEITFTVRFNPQPTNDLEIDVLDDVGVLLQSERISQTSLHNLFTHTMTITGASGARILRLRSGSFETSNRFVVVK
jgi:hypothetical protein